MDASERLRTLRTIQQALDEAFRVPGTGIRFGWDSIVGLVPWAGDAVTAALACVIVFQAHRMRVPRVVLLRMIGNVALDLLIGIVPVFGDVADVFWKANTRNMALLERHAHAPGPARLGDWLFVGALLATIVAIAVVPLILLIMFLQFIERSRWAW